VDAFWHDITTLIFLFYFFYLEIKATIGGSSEAGWG
jgi:hypothetical protein